MSNKKEITSVETFISEIKQNIDIKNSKQFGYEFFFRGQASSTYDLFPGIYRENGKYIEFETKFYNEIISNNPEEFIEEKTTIEKLVKMQHFGIPTRLLDITINPLVALFFACNNNSIEEKNNDGKVFFFYEKENNIKFYNSDTVTILANLTKLSPNDIVYDDNSGIDIFNKQDSIQRLINYIKEDKPYFKASIQPKDIDKCIFLKAKYNNQSIIPKEYKKEILKELDIIGINESTLFPDLEKKAKYLKNKITNKNNEQY